MNYKTMRSVTRSQTMEENKSEKENNASIFGQPYRAADMGMKQKIQSADDINDERMEGLLHFSPGTDASNATMTRRLERLKHNDELRKAKMKKISASHGHVDLHAVEEKFLNSLVPVNSVSGREGNETQNTSTDTSFRQPLDSTHVSESSKATNATYIVQPIAFEAGAAHASDDNFSKLKNFTEMGTDKKMTHLAALTSWLNYLLDESSTDDGTEMFTKNKKDADQYLKKLLTRGNDRSLKKEDEPQAGHGYKFFKATRTLNEMRSRFCTLYKTSSVPENIAATVKSGKIAIRTDREIYANVGLQTQLLGLLLSFHPFYLHLGLETILSTNIELGNGSRDHFKTLAVIISQKLFKDPRIMDNRKYVQGRAKMIISDRGAEALLQHFLTKICQFLFIVDEAWRDNVISRKNRCLFAKQSAYKSIGDVVATLSRDLMTGASNLPKTLSRLGLILDRKQGFFEEFQYHVDDLLKDLSDGVILGRAVEIVGDLPYNAVIRHLRVPGGDRIRKVGNIKMVIAFAKEKGILPEEMNINADLIVQGNVDEIIPLLWRLVNKQLGIASESDDWSLEVGSICQELESHFGITYKIRIPLELADGRLFSFLWKRYYSYGTPFELFDGTTVLEKIANAAEYHFGIPSLMLANLKCKSDEKTLCLFTKIFISRISECHRFTRAAITIQRAYRHHRSAVQHRLVTTFSKTVQKDDSQRMNAVITIQRRIRTWLQRKRLLKTEHQNDLLKQEKAAFVLQQYFRTWFARVFSRKLRREKALEEQHKKVVVIQKYVRGWLARKRYRNFQHEMTLRNAAVTLQKFIRGWIARTLYQKILLEHNIQKRDKAAIILQKYARVWLVQKLYHKMQQEKLLQVRENAACTLQRYVRGWLSRMQYRNLQHEIALIKREKAAVTLQRYVRGWIVRSHYRKMQREMALREREREALTLQSKNDQNASECSRSISSAECLEMLRKLKRQHERLRKKRLRFIHAVEVKIRFALLIKAEKDRRIRAAIVIQAWWRGNIIRKRNITVQRELAANRIARQEAVPDDERTEQMRPIIDRVMSAMKNLNSERLYIRYRATEVLQKFVGLSELCAQYVFNNSGLECILDSLDGCNRSVGSTEVVIPLCSIMWSVLKFKSIRQKLSGLRQKDVVKQCYHFMLAFHRVPNVVTDLSRIVLALRGNHEQYDKAPYYITELAGKFAKLPEHDERVIALRKLQNLVR